MASQKVLKLKCNEKDYYLMTTKSNDDLELILTDISKAWKGKVTEEDLSARSKVVEVADCAEQSRSALTDDRTDNFEYELKGNIDSNESVQLVWKKVIEKDSIKFQLGSASLEPCENPGLFVAKAFNHLLDDANTLRRRVKSLELDRDRLAEERSSAIKKLGDCASLKEDTEHSLYAKFVVILNEKKAKIRNLKEQLEASHTSQNATQPAVTRKSAVRNVLRRTSENSAMEVDRHSDKVDTSDHELNTDEEGENKFQNTVDCTTVTSSTKSAEEARRNRTVSAGSQSPLSFMLEDSANNGDDDELPVVAKRGKRTDVEDHKESDTSPQKRAEAEKDSGKSTQKSQRIPCMLSTTGTTNTSTTSSDRQRHTDMTTSSNSKKETQKPTTQSTDIIDDLLGDMA